MEVKKRYNGIDIIKLIAIIFVPFLHYYINFNFDTIPMVGYSSLIKIGIRWLTFSCIGLFLMSSGYLLSNKKVTKNYYLKSNKFYISYLIVLLLTTLYNIGFTPDFFIILSKNFFSFHGYFWYVPFYLVIYYLVPYLNIISDKLEKKEYILFLVILIILISIPEFYNSFPGYDNDKIFYFMNPFYSLYPFIYYYIGAYFKKYNPSFSKRKSLLIIIITLMIISCINYTYSKGSIATFYGGGYGNIISIIVTTCIFNIFYNVNIKNKTIAKTIKFSASLTFETYLALALSDKLTEKIVSAITKIDTMSYKYIFITSPINFIIAFIIAIVVHLFIVLVQKAFLEQKK